VREVRRRARVTHTLGYQSDLDGWTRLDERVKERNADSAIQFGKKKKKSSSDERAYTRAQQKSGG